MDGVQSKLGRLPLLERLEHERNRAQVGHVQLLQGGHGLIVILTTPKTLMYCGEGRHRKAYRGGTTRAPSRQEGRDTSNKVRGEYHDEVANQSRVFSFELGKTASPSRFQFVYFVRIEEGIANDSTLTEDETAPRRVLKSQVEPNDSRKKTGTRPHVRT